MRKERLKAAVIRQTERNEERKKLGICIRCSKKAKSGRVMCVKHLKEAVLFQAQWRKNRKAKGLCIIAGCKCMAVRERVMCKKHARIGMASNRIRNKDRKEAGKCTNCNNAVTPGRVMCAKHLRIARVERAKRAEGINKKCAVDYLESKEMGQCVRSGCKNRAKPGTVACRKHLKATSEYYIRQREERIAVGRCTSPTCKKLAAPERAMCKKHLKAALVRQMRYLHRVAV